MTQAPHLHLLLKHTADSLVRVRGGASLTTALDKVPVGLRPGTQALSFQVMRWLGSAEAARRILAPKDPPPQIDALLCCALALLWPDAEAPYASHTVVDEAVTCISRVVPRSAGFVNAVLRNFLRRADTLVAQVHRDDPVGRWNHPRWWIRQLQQDWPGQAEAVLESAQQRPPLTLRHNRRRGPIAADLAAWDAAGLAWERTQWPLAARVGWPEHGGPEDAMQQNQHAPGVGLPDAVTLRHAMPVQQIPGFASGHWSVQDAAAQGAAELLLQGLSSPERLRLLDACAAPGGKTAHLLECSDADLWALDVDGQRLHKVGDTLRRLGLHAHCVVANAAHTAQWWDGRAFDGILLDAPCSGSGIVRRHPDARWLRRAGDIAALVRTQAELLDALWPLLRPGGHLLYATCSVFRAEGEGQIAAFLQRHALPASVLDPRSPGHLLPLTDNAPSDGSATTAAACDGFFYALLRKP